MPQSLRNPISKIGGNRIKNACKGAAFIHEMEVQFDSTGGDSLETPPDEIAEWIEQIKRS